MLTITGCKRIHLWGSGWRLWYLIWPVGGLAQRTGWWVCCFKPSPRTSTRTLWRTDTCQRVKSCSSCTPSSSLEDKWKELLCCKCWWTGRVHPMMLQRWSTPSGNGRRWVVRAEELQLVLPDPLVLAGVVAKMSDALARLGGAQAAYRLSSVRQHLGIDLRPGMQEIRTFSELLQAEAGEMAIRQPGNTIQGPTTKPNNVVGVKSMSGPDPSENPPKGGSKGKQDDAAGSSTGRRGRSRSCQLMRLMWSTRRRVTTGWLIRGAGLQNDAGLCTPSWTPKMADVSTVLEKGTPSVSVLLGKEVSHVNQKGGQ